MAGDPAARGLLIGRSRRSLVGAAIARCRSRATARYPAATARTRCCTCARARRCAASTLGFDALAADLYWIRAIQYFGGRRGCRREPRQDYDLLYPLLDLTTTLDPHFNIAYRFGAIFLAEPYPGGPGRPDLAIALLEKGLRGMPDKWEYMQDIGFVHYWWRHDYPGGARWFEAASQVAGRALVAAGRSRR